MTRAYYTTEDKELTLSRKDINDAGLDVKASENIEILPHSDALIHTGIRVQIPEGYVGFLKSRSGLSVKNKIEVGAGVIDSNYRGEIMVHLYNFGDNPFVISKGDRIAQLITLPYYTPEYHIIDELDETKRGENGFGSSGR
jgi:dUTP pyrophosphatase